MILTILFSVLVFFALAGQGLAQNKDETEKKSFFSQWQRKKSADSSGNSLLPFSWFRSKSDNKPETDSHSPKSPAASETLTPHQKSQNTAKTLDDFSSDDLNIAPLPPDNPYYEQNRTLIAGRQNSNLVSISESVELPDLDTVPSPLRQDSRLGTPNYSEEPTLTGISSYSFDTRDWVESFPVDHVSDQFSSNQATPLNNNNNNSAGNRRTRQEFRSDQTVASNIPAAQQNNSVINSATNSMQWDGQVTAITGVVPPSTPTNETQSVKLTSLNRSSLDRVKEKEPEATHFGIDLAPSYAARLKYSEVYGVVVVQANFPLTEIKPILEEIRQLQIDLNLYMGIPAPKEKIELCLFRDEKTYLKFLQEVFPKAPRDRRALYIKIDDKPGTLLVQKTDEFEIDLRHEMTHAIIHASILTVPIWLDEGLAKYFEVPIKDRAEKNPYMKQIRWNTKFGAVPSLNRLEKLEHIGQMGDREYRDSWAWVHFLIHHSPQSHRLIAGYLQFLSTLPVNDTKNHDSVQVPPISLYLDGVVEKSREKYREHFSKLKIDN
ncbi:MAG: hypothetical protein LBQ50_04510 [Planctomycetaceae bacterium]|jgi:hypothetical protein|nr:hypothetical protein [Planctomycetaceae bacterium]